MKIKITYCSTLLEKGQQASKCGVFYKEAAFASRRIKGTYYFVVEGEKVIPTDSKDYFLIKKFRAAFRLGNFILLPDPISKKPIIVKKQGFSQNIIARPKSIAQAIQEGSALFHYQEF